MAETTTVHTPTQVGRLTSGGTFANDPDAGLYHAISNIHAIGLYFSTFPFEEVGTRDGTTLYQTARYYRTLSLTLDPITVGVETITVTVSVVDEVNPDPFSDSRLPGTLDEVEVASFSTSGPTGSSVTVDLDLSVMHGAFTETENVQENPYIRLGFEGNLALVLTIDTGSFGVHDTTGTPPTISATGVPFHSGVSGVSPIGGRGFIDEKTGQITTEDQVMVDGYTSLRVLPENFDPEDERERVYRPSPRRFGAPRR